MFSLHYEGLGHSLFTPKLASGTHCAPGTLFFTLLVPLLVPKRSQGRPRDIQKSPKGLPKPPRGHLKSSEIDVGPHLGIQRGPGSSRGTPGTANDSQIDEKTIKNNSIPHCFFNIFGATLGNTVPQKGEHSVLVLTLDPGRPYLLIIPFS